MTPSDHPRRLTPRERAGLMALARAATPGGAVLPPFGEQALDRLEDGLVWLSPSIRAGYLALTRALVAAATVGNRGSPDGIPPQRLAGMLHRVAGSGRLGRLAVDGALAPLRSAHFDDPLLFEALGCPHDLDRPGEEPARWHRQVLRTTDVTSGDALECDAVVVGSGAGGAVVACRLAEAGYAVCVLEEGEHFRREHFTGRPVERLQRMYRAVGLLPLHGNTRLTLPLGRTLGGSTTVNSATCYRAPAAVSTRWERELGLTALSPGLLEPLYGRVERELEIAPCEPEHWGGVARVVARGCDALGYAHGPVSRNAPECDAQALCAFGCPSGAKRSADVTWMPRALRSGALAVTGAEVRRLLVEGDRVRGVVFRRRGAKGSDDEVTVHGKVVVVAAGAIHTPGLLQRSLRGSTPAALGRHLTVHPASMALAVMDEPVRGWEGIPQSYAIEEFVDEGLIFEGGFTPPDIPPMLAAPAGRRCTELMDRYDRFATFGSMIADESTGRVFPRRGGEPVVTYWLGARDVSRLNRGLRILCRVYFAAGAREVVPLVADWPSLRSPDELAGLPRFGPGELDLTAFHPLGTARMGLDPATSVVDPDHRIHGLEGAYVVDGSVVPTPLGVNPQLTIMALATRAGGVIARELERLV